MAKLGNITTIITAVIITLTTRFVLIFINDTSIVFFPVCEQTTQIILGELRALNPPPGCTSYSGNWKSPDI